MRRAKNEIRAQELKKTTDEKQLVLLAGALAVIDNKAEEAKAWVQGNMNVNIASDISLGETNSTGYTAGQEAGKQVKLDPDQKSLGD